VSGRSLVSNLRPNEVVIPFGPLQCLEASNSSRLQLSGRHGNSFGSSSEFEKIPTFKCIHLDYVAISSRPQSEFEEKLDFLLRHVYGIQLHPFGRQDYTVRTRVLIMVITCSRNAAVWTLGQNHPDAALLWKLSALFWKRGCS
jgi:hypothetical protein